MNEEKFVNLHKENWAMLTGILDKTKRKGLKKLSRDQLEQLSHLYRKASADLAYARSHLKNTEIIYYLNQLVARAYNQIYTSEPLGMRRIINFLSNGFPRLLRQNIIYIAVSFSILLSGLLFGYIAAKINYSAVRTILPPGISSIENGLREGIGNKNFDFPSKIKPEVSSFIITNNIQVSITAFAGGMLLGILTVYIIFYNGLMLGALISLAGKYHLTKAFLALTLPHGIIELTAIFVSGGAGFILACALINPGEYSRKDSLSIASRKAVKIMLGVIVLLICAGIIEGFFTPLKLADNYKLLFAAGTLIFLTFYLGRHQSDNPINAKPNAEM